MTNVQSIIFSSRKKFEDLFTQKIAGNRLCRSEFMELWKLYLEQPEWIRLIEIVGNRCNNVCEKCKNAPYEECHHLTYVRRFRENPEDLLGVCRKCHNALTEEQKNGKMGRVVIKYTFHKKEDTKMTKFENVEIVKNLLNRKDTFKINRDESKCATSLKFTGLITAIKGNKDDKGNYKVTDEFKNYQFTDEQIEQFIKFFTSKLSKIPKNLPNKEIIETDQGYLKAQFRIYHPDFKSIYNILKLTPSQNTLNKLKAEADKLLIKTKISQIKRTSSNLSPKDRQTLLEKWKTDNEVGIAINIERSKDETYNNHEEINNCTIKEFILNSLKLTANQSAEEITKFIIKSGFKTTSKDFKNVVGTQINRLIKDKLVSINKDDNNKYTYYLYINPENNINESITQIGVGVTSCVKEKYKDLRTQLLVEQKYKLKPDDSKEIVNISKDFGIPVDEIIGRLQIV